MPWQPARAVSAGRSDAASPRAQAEPAAGCGLSELGPILASGPPCRGGAALAHELARYRRGDRRWSRVQQCGLLDTRARARAARAGWGSNAVALRWANRSQPGSPACPPCRRRLRRPEPAKSREFLDRQSLPETLAVHPTNEIGVPFFTRRASASASQLVRRTQPCDCVLPTLSGSGVP